jgi:forespore regulator of the sigma-K checkpoint
MGINHGFGKKAMTMGWKNALKKLKRQFRRKRGWLLAGLLLAAAVAWFSYDRMQDDGKPDLADGSLPAIAVSDGETGYEVVLHKRYLCGEQYEPLGRHSSREAEEMLRSHPEWKLESIDENRLVYSVEVADFSPECRNNAYFGLDGNNSLALFEGRPGEGRVIRTFFQVDVEHLQNSLPRETVTELMEGIKVTDYAEYSSVLSTFSEFALPGAEPV